MSYDDIDDGGDQGQEEEAEAYMVGLGYMIGMEENELDDLDIDAGYNDEPYDPAIY